MASILRAPDLAPHKRKLSGRPKPPPQTPPSASVTEPVQATGLDPVLNAPAMPEPAPADTNSLQSVIEQARQAVLAQFKDEADAARELARQRGLREGRAEGLAQAQKELAVEIARIKALAEQIPQTMQAGVASLEDLAVAIAFEAVGKILGITLVTAPAVAAAVRQAAAQAVQREPLTVRLHPADLALLREAGLQDSIVGEDRPITWLPDPRLELGGCVIEAAGGELDARLETQMDRFKATLLAARNSGA